MQQPSSRVEKRMEWKSNWNLCETLRGLIDTDNDSVLNAWKEHFLIFAQRTVVCRTYNINMVGERL